MRKNIFLFLITGFLTLSASVHPTFAYTISNLNAPDLIPKTQIKISPSSGTFTEGGTFEVPVYVNTNGSSISAIELHIDYDPATLAVIKPSSGTSVIGLWIQNPSYDNSEGTITLVGGIPNGLVTDSGLVTTITFQAKSTGSASVHLDASSRALLNDGSGSPSVLESNQASYTIVPRQPGAVSISSETHPFQDTWYNNNDPVFTWNTSPDMTGFSYTFDNKPGTIPDNTVDGTDAVKAYTNVNDGVSYFHIKALRQGIWSSSSDFKVEIDTTPPAAFTPTVDYLTAAVINRGLVSFFTTDALSGIDHYEVGVIDKDQPVSVSPVFVRADSPYQIPLDSLDDSRVIIRAFDKAGNVRDESLDVRTPLAPILYIKKHLSAILAIILCIIIVLFILHYFIGHKVIRHVRTLLRLASNEKELEEIESKESDPTQRS